MIHFSIPEIQQSRREHISLAVYNTILTILLFLGLGGSLIAFAPAVMYEILLVAALFFCVAFTVIMQIPKIRLWGLVAMAVWLIIFYIAMSADMFNGLRLYGNHIGGILGQRFGRIYPIYLVPVEEAGHRLVATLFSIPVCVLLAALCAYIARTKDVAAALVVIIVVTSARVFFRLELSIIRMGLLYLAMIILLAVSHEAKRNFRSTSSKTRYIAAGLATLVLAVCAATAFIAIPASGDFFFGARGGLIRNVDRWRYSVNPALGMPDGDFTDLGSFEMSTETALEVFMERPESLWLRGFVGSEYTGSGWNRDDSAILFEQADLFYWLHRNSFYGQTQLSNAALAGNQVSGDRAFYMRINNVGASSRNIYAPYELLQADESLLPADKIGGVALESAGFRGTREYGFMSLPNLVKRFPDVLYGLYVADSSRYVSVQDFLYLESNYALFIYEQYTRIPPEIRDWMDAFFTDIHFDSEETTFASAKQDIISYFETLTYTTNPPPGADGDFVQDFLLADRAGYSVHFATAGTLMFRRFGIPARYVEGYLITPEDVEGAPDDVLLRLTGQHAHSWVEVYLDGVGWIPVEVTPPYIGVMEEADSLEGIAGSIFDQVQGDAQGADDIWYQHETPPLDETEGIRVERLLRFLMITGMLILLLMIALAVYFIIKQRRWLKKRLTACNSPCNKTAVKAMFICAMESLNKAGTGFGETWLYRPLTGSFAGVNGFRDSFHIYERAVYSAHDVSDEEREEVKDFLSGLYPVFREEIEGLKGWRSKQFLRRF